MTKSRVCLFLLVLLNLSMVLFFMFQKQVIHVDEMFSYAHANSSNGAFLSQDIDSYFAKLSSTFYNKWLNAHLFFDYLTVQPDEAFRYDMIWENLANGVHPPLYYVLLHTICSFFPDMFSLWFAGALNVILWIALLVVFYRLSWEFFSNSYWAMLPVILYAFSEAGFATVLFLRLYLLQTLFAVWLVYLNVRLIKQNDANIKNLFLIFCCSLAGLLTQYNSLVFSFIVSATTCLLLLFRKNYSLLCKYACVMLASVAFLFIIFPTAWSVLFFSQRAVQASTMLDKNLSEDLLSSLIFLDIKLSQGWNVLISSLLEINVSLRTFLLVSIGYVVVAAYSPYKSSVEFRWLTVIFGGGFLFITLVMPFMEDFHLRYFMCLFPFAAIVVVYFLRGFLLCLNVPQYLTILCVALAILSWSCYSNFVNFYSRTVFNCANTSQTNHFIQDVRGKNVIVVVDGSWLPFYASSYYLKDANEVYFLVKGNPINVLDKADFVLYINKGWDNTAREIQRKPHHLSNELNEKLKYVSLVNVGWVFFDLYEVVR